MTNDEEGPIPVMGMPQPGGAIAPHQPRDGRGEAGVAHRHLSDTLIRASRVHVGDGAAAVAPLAGDVRLDFGCSCGHGMSIPTSAGNGHVLQRFRSIRKSRQSEIRRSEFRLINGQLHNREEIGIGGHFSGRSHGQIQRSKQ